MKKLILFLLVLLLSISLVCSCNGTGESSVTESSSDAQSTDSSESEESSEQTEDSSEISSDENPAEQPDPVREFYNEAMVSGLPEQATVPGYCGETSEVGVYASGITSDSDSMYVESAGNWLVVSSFRSGTGGENVRIFDIQTGSLLLEYFDDYTYRFFYTEAGIYRALQSQFQLEKWDWNQNEWVLVYEDDRLNSWTDDYRIDSTGTYFLFCSNEDSFVAILNLTTMEMHKFAYSSYLAQFVYVQEDTIWLMDGNYTIWKLNLSADTIEEYASLDSWYQFSGMAYIKKTSMNAESTIYVIGSLNNQELFSVTEVSGADQYFGQLGYGVLVSYCYDGEDAGTYFYDIYSGSLLCRVSAEMQSAKLLGNGLACYIHDEDGKKEIYYVDLTSQKRMEPETSVEIITLSSMSQGTEEIQQKLLELYGLELLVGPEGNDFNISGYTAKALTDVFDIYFSLKDIDEILAEFPEGMIREIWESTNKGMKFYICGEIYGYSTDGISTAGAVTSEDDGYIVIAFDYHNGFLYNLPHELSHAMDRKIRTIEEDWISVYENITPSGYYVNSYVNYYKNEKYTATYETEDSRIWFIDNYARCYSTEDRARILEYLFVSSSQGSLNSVLNHEHLLYKAKAYCYILRQCFESCRNADSIFWEKYLEGMDDFSLAV